MVNELRTLTEKFHHLREEHQEMERRYGIRSVAKQESELERLEEETETARFSNPELRKRISRAGKLRRKVTRVYTDMAANEAEMEEVQARRTQLKADLTTMTEGRAELYRQREELDKELEAVEKPSYTEEIATLEKEIAEKKQQAVEKNRQVVGIMEQFFRTADEFAEKAKKAAAIDERIDALLPAPLKPKKAKH
jgi:chromosome segregation ATPase